MFVTVQVSLYLQHNTWFPVLSWRCGKEMFSKSPKNNTDLPISMDSTRLSFNVFSSCTKKLSRCETSSFTKQPGLVSKRTKPKFSVVVSKWCCHPLGALVAIQVSLHFPSNAQLREFDWWSDMERFFQHRMKKSSRNVRHCHFHVLCQSQHERNSRSHDRKCSSKE